MTAGTNDAAAGPDGLPELPAEVRDYLAELVRRIRRRCGPHLVSVLAGGSVALGDYRHGRSDVDVTVVVDRGLPATVMPALAEDLAHARLPCPAAGLELVVYGEDAAARPSGGAGWLLDLNTGAQLPGRAAYDPSGSPAFWYVIDRAVTHGAGRLLHGRPAREAVAAPPRPDLLAAVRDSVREHADGDGHLADNRVLNGCRAVVFCRTGEWTAKREAARRVAASEAAFRPVVEAALRSFERPRADALALPDADVRAFLAAVREIVDEAAREAGTPHPRPVRAAPPE